MVLWVYFLLSLFPTIFSACDIGGTWSTWRLSTEQTGYDYCGSCWKANWVRRCLSSPACPCNGPTKFTGETNIEVCSGSRWPCCPGYRKIKENGSEICVNNITGIIITPPIDETPLPNNYCPPSGVGIWSSWSSWGACTASCGQFGTKIRTRKCISEVYGCPCFASDWGPCQTAPCPESVCPQEPKCKGPRVSSYEGGGMYCYPFEATPPIGSWTEWGSFPPCNDTCGMYGRTFRSRICLPTVGSECNGAYRTEKRCPADPCTDGRPACQDGYEKTVLEEGEEICVEKKI